MPSSYTAQKPSPRYRELVALSTHMHEEGWSVGDSKVIVFRGTALAHHVRKIKELIDHYQIKALLDYGAGKGQLYSGEVTVQFINGETVSKVHEYWGADVTCYDPAYKPYMQRPTGQYDLVINTDVLEHCPEADIPWIIDDLFSLAKRCVYSNIACFPAKKQLPNGENAHCTVQPPEWWQQVISTVADRYPHIDFFFTMSTLENYDTGTNQDATSKINYIPFNRLRGV
jgi:hypothetical protein